MEMTLPLVDQISGTGIYASAANWAKSADNADTLGGHDETYYYPADVAQDEFTNIYADIDYISAAVDSIAGAVQSDWEESDTTSLSYILNKPDLDTKLDVTAFNEALEDVDAAFETIDDDIDFISAAVDAVPPQVQSDWVENDITKKSYIQNKPTQLGLSAGEGIVITETSSDVTFSVSSTYITEPELTAALANFGGFEVVPSTGSDLHPDIADANTKTIYLTKDTAVTGSDQYKEWIWTAADPEAVPPVASAWNLIGDTSLDLDGYAQMPASHTASNIAVYGQGDTLVDNGVSLTGVQNVQSNWNETDSTSYAYIANKPSAVLIPEASPANLGGIAAPKYIMVVSAMPAATAIDPDTIYLVQGTYTGTT